MTRSRVTAVFSPILRAISAILPSQRETLPPPETDPTWLAADAIFSSLVATGSSLREAREALVLSGAHPRVIWTLMDRYARSRSRIPTRDDMDDIRAILEAIQSDMDRLTALADSGNANDGIVSALEECRRTVKVHQESLKSIEKMIHKVLTRGLR